MMGRCVEGTNDGKLVELACDSLGRLNSTASTTRIAHNMDLFPAGSLTLARGKVMTVGYMTALFASTESPVVIEGLNLIDLLNNQLDIDVYICTDDSSWSGTLSEGSYAYLNSTVDVLGVVRVRAADYTTAYSSAGVVGCAIATKSVLLTGQRSINDLILVAISAGTSVAVVTASKLQIGLIVRDGG